MHVFAEPHLDGTVEVRFTVRETDDMVEVVLDIDFLLHPAWPSIDHLVLRHTTAGEGERAVTVRIPADAELSYRYLRYPTVPGQRPVDSPVDLDVLRSLVATGRADPDVTETIHDAFGSGTTASLLIGPHAAPGHRVWRQENRAAASTPLRLQVGDRIATILLPNSGTAANVGVERLVVMLDGDVWLSSLGIADAATRWREPATAARTTAFVVLPTPDRERLADREAMGELVLERVIPAVLATLEITPSAADIAVVGQSYGGLAAAGLVVDHGDRIATAIISSGSFWFTPDRDARDESGPGALTRQLLASNAEGGTPLDGRRFLMHVGREEGSMIDQSRMFADAARGAGAAAVLEIRPGGHDYAWYRHAVFDALDHW